MPPPPTLLPLPPLSSFARLPSSLSLLTDHSVSLPICLVQVVLWKSGALDGVGSTGISPHTSGPLPTHTARNGPATATADAATAATAPPAGEEGEGAGTGSAAAGVTAVGDQAGVAVAQPVAEAVGGEAV